MTDHIEGLLRESARRQAGRADPGRVRAALPEARASRRRRHRYGALTAVASAAVVAATVTVPVLALRDGSTPDRAGSPGVSAGSPATTGPSAPSPSAARPAPVVAAGPLRYVPTWLPAGVTEHARSVVPGDGVVMRYWSRSGLGVQRSAPDGPSVNLIVDRDADKLSGGAPVDINGVRGNLADNAKGYVSWRMGADIVTVSRNGLPVSTDDLLRIARSVRADTTELRAPVGFGWLPDGMAPTNAEIHGDTPRRWIVEMGLQPTERRVPGQRITDGRSASVRFGTMPAPGQAGRALTVGGRPARWLHDGAETWTLYVDFGGGTGLMVDMHSGFPGAPGLTEPEVVRIAENLVVDGGTAATAWIGVAR